MQDSVKEKIEKRAYHLFLKRGGLHGYAMEDWVQAEKEIAAELRAEKKVEIKPPAASVAPAAPVAPVTPIAPAKPQTTVQKPVKKATGKNDKRR